MHHRLKHLGRGDNALAEKTTLLDKVLLYGGHFHKRNFNTEVAPRHHYSVGNAADFFYIVNSRAVFDLCDYINVGATVGVKKLAHGADIRLAGNEGGGDEINTVFNAEKKVALIRLGKILLAQSLVREIHTLSVGNLAARKNLTSCLGLCERDNLENDESVRKKDFIPDVKVLGEVLVGNRNAGFVTLDVLGGKGKRIALF